MPNSIEQATAQSIDYDLIVVKVLATVIIGHGAFLLAVVPLKLTKNRRTESFLPSPSWSPRRRRQNPRGDSAVSCIGWRLVLSLLLSFGHGVLLSTTLLGLQPEVRRGVHALQLDGRLPGVKRLGDILLCAGFFAAFLVDETAYSLVRWYYWLTVGRGERGRGERVLCRSLGLRRGSVSVAADPPPTEIDGPGGDVSRRRRPQRPPARSEPKDHCLRGLFTVLALSFHETFGGMAIGLENRVDHAWYLFLAVATHKLVVALWVGLELAWSRTRRTALLVYVAAFAAVTPVGIAFGVTIKMYYGAGAGSESESPSTVVLLLQGLAVGTLLYEALFRVLPRYRRSGWSHILSTMTGFGVLLMLQDK